MYAIDEWWNHGPLSDDFCISLKVNKERDASLVHTIDILPFCWCFTRGFQIQVANVTSSPPQLHVSGRRPTHKRRVISVKSKSEAHTKCLAVCSMMCLCACVCVMSCRWSVPPSIPSPTLWIQSWIKECAYQSDGVCIKSYTIGTADMRTRVLGYHLCIAAHTHTHTHITPVFFLFVSSPPYSPTHTLSLFLFLFCVVSSGNTISFICNYGSSCKEKRGQAIQNVEQFTYSLRH